MIPNELQDMKKARETTLDLVSELTQLQFDHTPRQGGWSIGEVLHHLILTDAIITKDVTDLLELHHAGKKTVVNRSLVEFDVSIAPIPKSFLKFAAVPFTINSRLLPKAMLNYMARSRWVPFRHPSAANPTSGLLAKDLRCDLTESHESLAAVFEGDPEVDYTRLIHKHPLFGVNNIVEVLVFGANHEGRHQEQIRDILRSADLPPTTPGN